MTRKLLIPVLALVAVACADNRSSIEILGRAAPSDETACTFTAGGEFRQGPGTLDVSSRFGGLPGYLAYQLEVYLNNNLTDPTELSPESLSSAKAFRAEAAKVRVNPKDYTDSFAPSPALLPFQGENTIPLDGATIEPGGKSVQLVDAISPALGQQLADALPVGESRRVVLGISIQGRTLDNQFLESAEWFFPIDVCDGCLLTGLTACVAGGTISQGNCFGFGQDSRPSCAP
jgi:hypothetical protein